MTLPDEVRSLLGRLEFYLRRHVCTAPSGTVATELHADIAAMLAAQPEPQGVELERYYMQAGDGPGVYPEKDSDGEWCLFKDAQHLLSTERAEAERKMAEKDAEIARLSGDLAIALKVPSVAAMHSFLDTECAKQNVKLAAERDQLRALLASPQDSAGAVAWQTVCSSERRFSVNKCSAEERAQHWCESGRNGVRVEPLFTTPKPAGPAVEVAGVREAFESAWDATTNSNGGVAYHVEITGKYCFSDIQQGFQMFQAGATWQRRQSAGECYLCQHKLTKDLERRLKEAIEQRDTLIAAIDVKRAVEVDNIYRSKS